MNLKTILILFSILTTIYTHAQQREGSVRGYLADSVTKKPLPLATITIFKASDTTILTYRISRPDGTFIVPGLPINDSLRIIISYSGYAVVKYQFFLTTENRELNFDTLRLRQDTLSLDEVLVLAERPPIIIKNDTIEFNASSFATLPSALVEDLLKKLPGVDVAKDGNITVNGKQVNRILVDGREFFGKDYRIATRNLPANIIDKVQVVDDEEDLYANVNKPKEELGKIINLKLKRNIKKGWFGKVYGGAGTDNKYEGGGMLNTFRDTLQISLLGYTNNINRAAFSSRDMLELGGFRRSFFRDMNVNRDGSVQNIDGLSFGGTNQGLEKSGGAGFNLNHELRNKTTLNIQYFYGQLKNELRNNENTQQFVEDTIISTKVNTLALSRTYAHQIGGSLKKKLSNVAQLLIRPTVNINLQPIASDYSTFMFSNFSEKLNRSTNSEEIKWNTFGYNHEILYNNNKINKTNGSISLSNIFRYGDNGNQQFNESFTALYYFGDSTTAFLDQFRNNSKKSVYSTINGRYTQPVSKKLTLTIISNLDCFNSRQQIQTFVKTPSGKYDSIVNSLSTDFTNQGFKLLSRSYFDWAINKQFRISPGIIWQLASINNEYSNVLIKQRFSKLYPYLSLQFKKISLTYQSSMQEPDPLNLQPVVNNTNPLFQFEGNPNLKPVISHNINFSTTTFIREKNLFYSLNIRTLINDNATIIERFVDQNGVQLIRPGNADGIISNTVFLSLIKQYKNANFQFRTNITVRGTYARNLILFNNLRSIQHSYGISPMLEWNLNWKDKIEISQMYTFSNQKSNYKNTFFRDLSYTTHRLESEMIIRAPKNLTWQSTLDLAYFPFVLNNIRKTNFLWNASLSYQFMKDKLGTLKLQVYDLLDRNTGISQIITENYIKDSEVLRLGQFIMLSFIYNIRYFKAQKTNARSTLFPF